MARADRLGGRDRHVDLGESLTLEAGGERDQPRVVPDGQRRDRRRVDAPGQKRTDSDVGAHVLGHRVLQDRGDLVVAGLLGAAGDRDRLEARHEVAGGRRLAARADARVAARFQPAHAAMQRLRFRHVLQDGVVLHGAFVDRGVEPDHVGQIQQTFLLAGHRGATGSGRHEQRLDAERVAGAEQFTAHGVPQREREHAPQPRQRVGAPVVVGGDDGLAVAVGREDGAVLRGELGAQLQVVVDLAVEHQLVAVGGVRRAPAQRLMRMRDVDDRQPVEAENDGPSGVGPGARLVGPAVTHQVRRLRDGFSGGVRGAGRLSAGRGSHEGQQSTHRRSVCRKAAVDHGCRKAAGLHSAPLRRWSTLRSIRRASQPTVPLTGGCVPSIQL